jgi:diguanylate cyclase (GGDEF)-like protein
MIAWPLLSDMRGELPTVFFILAYAVLVVIRQAMNWIDSLELNRHLVALNTRLEARTEFLSDSLTQERDRANRDPLTGVLNRRAILAELEQILAMPSIAEEVGAVGVADVDLLKEINDSFGHSSGDEALRRMAAALSLEGAIVGRVGGDEFVMILPGANEVRVEAYLALVDWRLQSSSHQDANDLKLGFSAGFCFYPTEARNSRQLLKLADERMYERKQNRRLRDSGSIVA